MLQIAEASSATRIEFANVQYYGWGFANRDSLLPTRAQLDQSLIKIKAAEERLRGKIRIESVVPDYYAKYPKPCMGGWGRKLMLDHAERRSAPLSRRQNRPRPTVRKRKGHVARRNLALQRRLPKIPRRILDARSLQNLRSPRTRLRRMPLPSAAPRRRRRSHRPCLHPLPKSRKNRHRPPSAQFIRPQNSRHKTCRGAACCAPSRQPTQRRSPPRLALPSQSVIAADNIAEKHFSPPAPPPRLPTEPASPPSPETPSSPPAPQTQTSPALAARQIVSQLRPRATTRVVAHP